jgi:hypothetical protein
VAFTLHSGTANTAKRNAWENGKNVTSLGHLIIMPQALAFEHLRSIGFAHLNMQKKYFCFFST